MSTLLLYTSPARGHLYPMMDVALAMQAAGHRVVVQTLSAEEAHVRAAGLAFRPIDPRIEALPLDDYQGANPLAQLRRTLAVWATRAPVEVEDLQASIAELGPALLLVDGNCWGAAAAAEASGLPWSLYLPYCLPVPSRDAPAFGPGFAPPKGWLGRLRDRLVWALQGWVGRDARARCNAMRARLGLGGLRHLSELFTRAPLLLYRTAEPFEYPRSDWPTNLQAIGPGLWAPPGEAPDWLDALPRPRVLVSVSTELQEDGAIIDTALQALGDQPGSLVVTTGALDATRFASDRPQTRILPFLPHAAVIPQMDLVLTHGGMGTTQRALSAGVPVCVVPWGRDQLETARRVERCGAGSLLSRERLSAGALRQAADLALSRRPQAAAVAQALAQAGGATQAVALLEGLLAVSPDPAATPRPPSVAR